MIFINILNRIDRYNKHQFDIPVEEQLAYMSSLGNPIDDIYRSYFQFKCQWYFSPFGIKLLWLFLSICAIPFILVFYSYKRNNCVFERKVDSIAEDKGMNEIIPAELSQKYKISHKEWNSGVSLSFDDIKYICSHFIGSFHPYFVLKAIIQIGAYSDRISRYQPERIITHAEFSFCSSLLTDYCHHRGIKLINVQHGEKLRYIRDSFFHFDECYVWDKHYVDMLTEMKAEPTQFRIAVPPSLKIDIEKFRKETAYADYKYYLAADNEQEIKSIVDAMAFAKREGKTVRYRIHPRYTDVNILKKYVSEDEIEYPKEVSIQESIANLEYAVGSYTTVLLQAHLSGKKVILNDVTFPKRYLQLKEYGYILAKDDIARLSDKSR